MMRATVLALLFSAAAAFAPRRMQVTMGPDRLPLPIKEKIDGLVSTPVFLFMKGNREAPRCGFSNTAVKVLQASGATFETFDVMEDPDVRQGIKEYSDWPTIPQLYVNQEFVGGADIMIEMYRNGELQEMLEVANANA
mmetsp:Transcript_25548/g.79969  ORF Transcript_25548/g.79969 Transcript_25548/m.79969 type:complete len:138 (-) Transcript_25548:183-596(-)|eukprot:CAMPEP_0118867632 /NCGR_PEP_ID=MMETSP1163-20130328/11172_1 /TAXON_ID=124430 /ORGANISM="Phaeomonas parva, Strain CCMP2877" /LENGTH=137 /DNA_ID=CAMNT_0006802065 /DNA_START=24 /DNA_END=437 /DNA_ORIENTATION=+